MDRQGGNKEKMRKQLVEIFFDTAIERDKKIKTEAQLSLIGGTMGLLTGFSIISGVEIVFFLFRQSVIFIQGNLLKYEIIRYFLSRLVRSVPSKLLIPVLLSSPLCRRSWKTM